MREVDFTRCYDAQIGPDAHRRHRRRRLLQHHRAHELRGKPEVQSGHPAVGSDDADAESVAVAADRRAKQPEKIAEVTLGLFAVVHRRVSGDPSMARGIRLERVRHAGRVERLT